MNTSQGYRPTLLVTGCNGLLGQKLVGAARSTYRTVGLDHVEWPLIPCDEYISVDIAHGHRVVEVIEQISPTVVVNTAALTNVDACEKDRDLAWAVNVEGVRHLAEGCQKIGAMLVQISSDYVFDGEKGPYDEDAEPNPLGFYGTTKLESERVLAASHLPWAVVRTNVLYGWAQSIRANFALWVYSHLAADKYIRAAIDQYGNPTLADNLAAGILTLLSKGCQGIFHLAGTDYMSRWAFALKIARVFGFNHELIAPVLSSQLSQKAPRPHWGGLKMERTVDTLEFSMIGVQEGLTVLKKQIPSGEMEDL
jgi:dTDP-4-dehydrorhamnose reductase